VSQENVIFKKKLMKIHLFCIVQQASGQGVPEIIGQVKPLASKVTSKTHIFYIFIINMSKFNFTSFDA
jgi:hypothetical protein